MGQAVGFARDCKADLRSIQHSSLSKAHIRKSAIAARAAKEEENATELLSKYTMINDTVSVSLTHSQPKAKKKSIHVNYIYIYRFLMNTYPLDKIYKS